MNPGKTFPRNRRSGQSPLRRPLILIGAMAVGKTAIGTETAALLGVDFVDTDAVLEQRHGPVADIFANHGEGHFRQLESRAVVAVLESMADRPGVISLGGGAVLDSGTQQLLARATVVHLDADRETVRHRISRNTGRPLLASPPSTHVSPAEAALLRWDELAAVRAPVYRRVANLTLDVRHGSTAELARRLVALLGTEPDILNASEEKDSL